jgi:hypothetical protein
LADPDVFDQAKLARARARPATATPPAGRRRTWPFELTAAYDRDRRGKGMDIDFGLPLTRTTRRTAGIYCQVVRLRDFRLVADRIENLSPTGMLVGPADPVLTGEPLIISFRLPGLSDFIDAEAEVSRVAHGRRPGETRRCLGLHLFNMDGYSRRLLEAYLRCLPPAPPDYRVTIRHSSRWQRRAAAYA